MSRVVTFAVMGDSAASGVGDSDRNGINKGWGYYLAKHFDGPLIYLNVSRPGAQSFEVLNDQLPKALLHLPDITAVIVGGNDALRNGFNPEKVRHNLRQILIQLHKSGSEILLLELHDPTRIVPFPPLVGSVIGKRIDAVNAVTLSLAKEFDAIILRTRKLENIYDRKVWHVDRMHPSKFGHQLIATNFRELLVKVGWNIQPIETEPISAKSNSDTILWMLKHGIPWFLKRSLDLFPSLIYIMAGELASQLKTITQPSKNNVIHVEFKNQSEAELQEVFEQRIS